MPNTQNLPVVELQQALDSCLDALMATGVEVESYELFHHLNDTSVARFFRMVQIEGEEAPVHRTPIVKYKHHTEDYFERAGMELRSAPYKDYTEKENAEPELQEGTHSFADVCAMFELYCRCMFVSGRNKWAEFSAIRRRYRRRLESMIVPVILFKQLEREALFKNKNGNSAEFKRRQKIMYIPDIGDRLYHTPLVVLQAFDFGMTDEDAKAKTQEIWAEARKSK